MTGFFQRTDDGIVARFGPDEAVVVRRLVGEVLALLEHGGDHSDPVVNRLFPDGYQDNPMDAAEFRRLTEGDLHAGRLEAAGSMLSSLPEEGGPVTLDDECADAWLRTLTDVRIALGTRLGIEDETDITDEIDDAVLRDPTSPRSAQLSVYAYLTYLQDSLVVALTGW